MTVLKLPQLLSVQSDFRERVKKSSGQDVSNCYQCGKCSAGCPVAFSMDYRPNQIIRMIQLGMAEAVLNSRTIWLCATCSTCVARCPRKVDLCKIMDTCRILSYQSGKVAQVRNEVLFHEIFLSSIAKHGRLYELGLMMARNLQTGKIFQDAELGLPTLMKGKLNLRPPQFEGAGKVREIMAAVKRVEGAKEDEV